MNAPFLPRALAFALPLAVLASPLLKADNFDFQIDLDTAALASAPNGPFYLDFQLNEGSGTVANSVTLSDFQFVGGSASGTPMLFGNATGSLGGTVSLTDNPSSPFNEFFQGFSSGTTAIRFEASITQNSPGATPDGFFAAILDSEPNFPQIGTDAPDGVSLVSLSIDSANTTSDIGLYHSVAPAGVTAVAVPEASTMLAIPMAALVVLAGWFRRRNAEAAAGALGL